MEGEYDAAASTIKIEDVTDDDLNRDILRRLKENDPELVELRVSNAVNLRDENEYCLSSEADARELEWLGYYIGKNTSLKLLGLNGHEGFNNATDIFCRGVNSNGSIEKITFCGMGGEIFQSLRPLFENNQSLSALEIYECQFGAGGARQLSLALRVCNKSLKHFSMEYSRLGDEQLDNIMEALGMHPQLEKLEMAGMNIGGNCETLANLLRSVAANLQELNLSVNVIDYEKVDALADALANAKLRVLDLSSNPNIGTDECTSLANLLRSTATTLQELSLCNNDIDDEGVDSLVEALANGTLQSLSLSRNNMTVRGCESLATLLDNQDSILETLYLTGVNVGDNGALILANKLARNCKLKDLSLHSNGITARGCRGLAAVLENSHSNLESLSLGSNNVGDEGASIFANALTGNYKLKELYLNNNGITAEGWSAFSKALCDTSSVNNTFLSNHTLSNLGMQRSMEPDVASLLELNGICMDKRQAAIEKILKYHRDFDMQPFLEWDLKVLPLAMKWFERARYVENDDQVTESSVLYFPHSDDLEGINNHKLGAIYQFVRAMPEVFEPAPAAGEKGKRSASKV